MTTIDLNTSDHPGLEDQLRLQKVARDHILVPTGAVKEWLAVSPFSYPGPLHWNSAEARDPDRKYNEYVKEEVMVEVDFESLRGETIVKIDRGIQDHWKSENERLDFYCESGKHFAMYHVEDCCETVSIEDICGDLDDLIGNIVVFAYESTNQTLGEWNDNSPIELWTFYKIDTIKGGVTIRWFGESEYYSIAVDFFEVTKAAGVDDGKFKR